MRTQRYLSSFPSHCEDNGSRSKGIVKNAKEFERSDKYPELPGDPSWQSITADDAEIPMPLWGQWIKIQSVPLLINDIISAFDNDDGNLSIIEMISLISKGTLWILIHCPHNGLEMKIGIFGFSSPKDTYLHFQAIVRTMDQDPKCTFANQWYHFGLRHHHCRRPKWYHWLAKVHFGSWSIVLTMAWKWR
jgi:hypothetical protein